MSAAIAPRESSPFPRRIQASPNVQSAEKQNLTEKEPPCSDKLQKQLNEDCKKIFKVVYQDTDKNNPKDHTVTIVAETKLEALTKFKKAFSVALVTSQDNEADRSYADKFTGKKPYRWDRGTEPDVYSEEEFAFQQAS
ncbi:MAG: hypothetical protein NTX82_00940 [Candidatus Parcubacteria bacterium]|nr:hypothetical protein [Candidatus Parcubacteria bacterium]